MDRMLSVRSGGDPQFRSGDGQTQLSGLGPTGGGGVTFTYLTAGDYVASASGEVDYHTCTPFGCLPNGGSGLGSLGFTVFENITVSAVPEPST